MKQSVAGLVGLNLEGDKMLQRERECKVKMQIGSLRLYHDMYIGDAAKMISNACPFSIMFT